MQSRLKTARAKEGREAKTLAVVAAVLMAVGWWSCRSAESRSPAQWVNEADVELHNETGIFLKDHQPFTGTVYSLAPNGKDTVAVGNFANGKEDGEWRMYFAGGLLRERRYYAAGKKVGVYEAWWPAGKRRLFYRFENGEYEGTCREWDENGTLVSEMNYKAGHEDGPQKQWYSNGRLKVNYVIQDGRRYGLMGTKNCVNVTDSIF